MENVKNEVMLQALEAFIAADKYELYAEWSPGDCTGDEEKKQVNELLNACAKELLGLNEESIEKQLATLSRYTSEIPALSLDTEDREFTHELLVALAGIIGIADVYMARNPVSEFLNSFKRIPVHEALGRQCLECGCGFTIDVQSRLDLVPPFWVITRCDTCDAIDYIELPEGLLHWSLKGCRWIEALEKTLYDREDVIEQLNILLQRGVLLKGKTSFQYLKI